MFGFLSTKAAAFAGGLPAVLSAADGTADVVSGGGSTTLSNLFDAGLQLAGFGFDVFDLILAHPVLCVFVVGGILGVGIGIVGRLAHASRSLG